jgi:hypothetical protein
MNIQQIDAQIRKLNAEWTGKQVYISGKHQHNGESGEVVGFEYLPEMNCISMKVSGNNTDFYVHDSSLVRKINYGD